MSWFRRSKKAKEFWFVPPFSLALQGFSALQFVLIQTGPNGVSHFSWQFYIFLGISMALSLYMGLFRRNLPAFLAIRLLLIFLIGYPLGPQIWLELTLLLSLLLEAGLYLTPPWSLSAMVIADAVMLVVQKRVNAFDTELPGPSLEDWLFFLVFSLAATSFIYITARLNRERMYQENIINRLDEALAGLDKTNLGLQNLTTNMELETLKKERKRISREIHDSVGYSLTNIRIMLDAASLMIDRDSEKTRELIRKSMEEAGNCLEETRDAMRQLRSKELSKVRGMNSLFQLINVFGEVTGIKVRVEFGNVPDSFGDSIDKAIFRFIQEGLINSFRHGRATEIRIYFWIHHGVLEVSLQDNGSGAGELSEGIGLAGMKERLSDLNGTMSYQNRVDGFEITIRLPFSRGDS